MLAMDLSMSLSQEGVTTIGPSRDVDEVMDVLVRTRPRAAILDINLGSGTTSEPVADELIRMGVPFAFLSAYTSDNSIAQKFPAALFASKPVGRYKLIRFLDALLESA